MLKHQPPKQANKKPPQPPSGGCVLKLTLADKGLGLPAPAAFKRLYVKSDKSKKQKKRMTQPPSGGCVLKLKVKESLWLMLKTSRLQAAVC